MAALLGYIERSSPIHQLSGLTKLICFLLWSFAAMLTYDTRVLVFLFFFSIIVFRISKIKWQEVSFVIILILIFLLINNIAIYLFSPQEGVKIYGTNHVLLELAGRYDLTLEQLFYQMNITLKYLAIIPVALLFLVTTDPSELAASLNKIGISYRLSYSISLALRYIPDIQREFHLISKAQQARGVDLSKNEKLWRRLKNAAAIILPLVMSSLDKIETISNAMELRGFGKHKRRTWYSFRPLKKKDYIALLIMIAIFSAAMAITFYDGSRFYNPFL